MASSKQTNADIAVALVYERQSAAQPSEAFVRHRINALGGEFITITYKTSDGKLFDNYIFFKDKEQHYFFNPTELMRYIDASQPRTSAMQLVREIATTGGAPALMALVITATICFLVMTDRAIPDILGNALTIILGFYFGSKVTEAIRDNTKK